MSMNTNKSINISEVDSLKCERLLGEEECKLVLKSFANNKNTGTDGLTTDFFKFFWIDIKQYFIDAFNYAFKNNILSISQRRGIIILLPKNKDPLSLKNWRPNTLLILIINWLKKLLLTELKIHCPIIHNDQICFLKGRYIGGNIRETIHGDIIEYAGRQKQNGIIASIDFEKAFDKIEWDFILKIIT